MFKFKYGDKEVELRSPDFGDSREYNLQSIYSTTPNYVSKTFRDSKWGIEKKFTYSFSGLKDSKKVEFLLFIKDTLGKKITIVDHLNITRTVLIVSNEISMVENKEDFNSVTIEVLVL